MGSSWYGYLVHMGLVYIVLVDMGLVGMGLAYMWAITVGTYISKYISKEEAGQSNLLKGIVEESSKQGESTDMKLKKLAKILEDTREVSMQEIIFCLFGYSMYLSSIKS